MIAHAPSWIASSLALLALASVAAPARAGTDTAAWQRVLSRFGHEGGLDYAGLAAAPEDLDRFLSSIADADLGAASTTETMAFYSNAYNAVTARFVLDDFPGIASVRDVDGFFDGRRHRVAGEALTLDEIEARALEPGDPRVHFAVVCASTGCPDLRGEAYAAERLDAQLEEQTRAFLADPEKGMRLDRDADTVWLSSIFKWYADDFTGGSRIVAYFARRRTLAWIVDHLPGELAEEIGELEPRVRYLDYDWSLNDRPTPAAGIEP